MRQTDLAQRLLEACRKRGLTIVTAESCTGGLLGAALTEIAGASDVYERGFVTYSNAAKTENLGVDAGLIETHGAVSEPVALAMAEGALGASGASLALSVTGVAGPGGSAAKPEGLVWIAAARKGAPALAVKCEFGALGRSEVRRKAVLAAMDHGLKLLFDCVD